MKEEKEELLDLTNTNNKKEDSAPIETPEITEDTKLITPVSFKRMNYKCLLFYFDSNKHLRIMKKKVKNGYALFKKKTNEKFDVSNTSPFIAEMPGILKKTYPAYFVRWDSNIPININWDKGTFENPITPENYGKLMDMGVVKSLLSLKDLMTRDVLFLMIIMLVLGGCIGYILSGAVGG